MSFSTPTTRIFTALLAAGTALAKPIAKPQSTPPNLGAGIPTASGLTVTSLTYYGDGCPEGTLQGQFCPETTSFNVTISDLKAILQDGKPSDDASCHIEVGFRTESQVQLNLLQGDFYGSCYLESPGMTALAHSSVSFAGNSGGSNIPWLFYGPVDAKAVYEHNLLEAFVSQCSTGGDFLMLVDLVLHVTRGPAAADAVGYIDINQLTGAISQAYVLQPSPCGKTIEAKPPSSTQQQYGGSYGKEGAQETKKKGKTNKSSGGYTTNGNSGQEKETTTTSGGGYTFNSNGKEKETTTSGSGYTPNGNEEEEKKKIEEEQKKKEEEEQKKKEEEEEEQKKKEEEEEEQKKKKEEEEEEQKKKKEEEEEEQKKKKKKKEEEEQKKKEEEEQTVSGGGGGSGYTPNSYTPNSNSEEEEKKKTEEEKKKTEEEKNKEEEEKKRTEEEKNKEEEEKKKKANGGGGGNSENEEKICGGGGGCKYSKEEVEYKKNGGECGQKCAYIPCSQEEEEKKVTGFSEYEKNMYFQAKEHYKLSIEFEYNKNIEYDQGTKEHQDGFGRTRLLAEGKQG